MALRSAVKLIIPFAKTHQRSIDVGHGALPGELHRKNQFVPKHLQHSSHAGLAVTREGIPVRVWCWPGNTNDMSVITEVKDDLRGWRLGRVVTVVDLGRFKNLNAYHYCQRYFAS